MTSRLATNTRPDTFQFSCVIYSLSRTETNSIWIEREWLIFYFDYTKYSSWLPCRPCCYRAIVLPRDFSCLLLEGKRWQSDDGNHVTEVVSAGTSACCLKSGFLYGVLSNGVKATWRKLCDAVVLSSRFVPSLAWEVFSVSDLTTPVSSRCPVDLNGYSLLWG